MNKIKKQLYTCAKCGLAYEEKKWAERCELWCARHKSCHVAIIKHSVDRLTKS